jgi:hypothetical protein
LVRVFFLRKQSKKRIFIKGGGKMKTKNLKDLSLIILITLFAAAFIVGQPHAFIITNTMEIDLGQVSISDDSSGGQLIFGAGSTLVGLPPFTAQSGDNLITTISFKDGDRLKIIDGPNTIDDTGPDFFESLTFYFTGPNIIGTHSSNTTSVVFSNLQGNLIDLTPGGVSYGVLAQDISPDFTDSDISFDGLTMTTTINTITNGNIYDEFGLWGGRAGGYEVISSNPVPIPGAVWLLGSGLIGIVGIRRKFRK